MEKYLYILLDVGLNSHFELGGKISMLLHEVRVFSLMFLVYFLD